MFSFWGLGFEVIAYVRQSEKAFAHQWRPGIALGVTQRQPAFKLVT